jgi:hypothetical protein
MRFHLGKRARLIRAPAFQAASNQLRDDLDAVASVVLNDDELNHTHVGKEKVHPARSYSIT